MKIEKKKKRFDLFRIYLTSKSRIEINLYVILPKSNNHIDSKNVLYIYIYIYMTERFPHSSDHKAKIKHLFYIQPKKLAAQQ